MLSISTMTPSWARARRCRIGFQTWLPSLKIRSSISARTARRAMLLGDAYEYLMKHFAVESGKSKGQFYTPAEVSRIIAKVIGAQKATGRTQTVYDPTCGSGSLLLKVAAETPK